MERKLKKSNLKIGDEIVIYTKDNGKILPYKELVYAFR